MRIYFLSIQIHKKTIFKAKNTPDCFLKNLEIGEKIDEFDQKRLKKRENSSEIS